MTASSIELLRLVQVRRPRLRRLDRIFVLGAAPEKGQPWGNRSRQHLAALCFGKPAIVSPRVTDRYGRTVARVECDGVDVSAEQVRVGKAWVFDRYVSDRGL